MQKGGDDVDECLANSKKILTIDFWRHQLYKKTKTQYLFSEMLTSFGDEIFEKDILLFKSYSFYLIKHTIEYHNDNTAKNKTTMLLSYYIVVRVLP